MTAERSGKIGLYIQGVETPEQLKDLLTAYRNDKRFLSKVERKQRDLSI